MQRRLFKVGDKVESRGDEIAPNQHFAWNLRVAPFIRFDESGTPEQHKEGAAKHDCQHAEIPQKRILSFKQIRFDFHKLYLTKSLLRLYFILIAGIQIESAPL